MELIPVVVASAMVIRPIAVASKPGTSFSTMLVLALVDRGTFFLLRERKKRELGCICTIFVQMLRLTASGWPL